MDNTHEPARTIAIFVCSTGNSPFIVECLRSLVFQKPSSGWSLGSVNVVWNVNPERASELKQWVSEALARDLPTSISLRHHEEHTLGIPSARNKAIQVAQEEGSGWILFVDDDCVPSSDLLLLLTESVIRHEADAVAGGWEIRPVGPVSSWLPVETLGRQHYRVDRNPACDGATLPTAYTRNVLFCLDGLESVQEPTLGFRELQSGGGGSDALFFYQLANRGKKIVYAKDAMVTEFYSGERLTLRWHALRRIRTVQQRQTRVSVTGEKKIPLGALAALASEVIRLPALLIALPAAFSSLKARHWIGTRVLRWAPYFGVVLLGLRLSYLEYQQRFLFQSVPIGKQKR